MAPEKQKLVQIYRGDNLCPAVAHATVQALWEVVPLWVLLKRNGGVMDQLIRLTREVHKGGIAAIKDGLDGVLIPQKQGVKGTIRTKSLAILNKTMNVIRNLHVVSPFCFLFY